MPSLDEQPCPLQPSAAPAGVSVGTRGQQLPLPLQGQGQGQGQEPPALTAAHEAHAFVTRLFAEMNTADVPSSPSAPDMPDALEAPPDTPDAIPAIPAIPATWPAAASLPLQEQQVLVLGLGASGLAMARWCARAGALVTVADTRSAPPQLATLQAELPQVRFVAGALTADLLQGAQEGLRIRSVYRSPGLSPQSIAPV
ncbi:MAG: UDP-N-acetylmuramoyl-L-alanine--D-glutamate ligase, partial [Comamonas sp.]|nr:UDP-N-acetylmuramoyl-L-alanine--D-glutamate ligase [Comamonas sp.]